MSLSSARKWVRVASRSCVLKECGMQHGGGLGRTHRSSEIQMVDGSTTTTQMRTSPMLRSPTKKRAADITGMVTGGSRGRHKS